MEKWRPKHKCQQTSRHPDEMCRMVKVELKRDKKAGEMRIRLEYRQNVKTDPGLADLDRNASKGRKETKGGFHFGPENKSARVKLKASEVKRRISFRTVLGVC